jgi:glycosyltransferase involved in cell wall biosynthesis
MARLSVVLTNYNHAWCLTRAIDAIANQSRPPDEFIIQDDGSTDNSIDVIMPYVEKYPFITFVKNERNLGAIPAMQKVSSLATGDYLYGAGADDWVLPGFFKKAMKLFEQYPQAGLCCGNPTAYIKETGELYQTEMMWADLPSFISPDDLSVKIAGLNIQGHTAIMKRDAFFHAGGFITDLKWHSDWFFNLVIAFRHGIVYLPESVAVDNARRDGSFCYEGSRDQVQQVEVLSSALRLLKSEAFRDVLPYFIRGGVFYPFSQDVIRLVMKKSEFWDAETLLLLQHPLYFWNKAIVAIKNDRTNKSNDKKINQLLQNCEKSLDKDNVDEAESIIVDLARMFPSIPQVHFLQAKIAFRKGMIKEAIGKCSDAIALKADDPQVHLFAGFLSYQSGNHYNAEKEFKIALTIDPLYLDALLNLAELAIENRRFTDAITYCGLVQKYYPENREVLEFIKKIDVQKTGSSVLLMGD